MFTHMDLIFLRHAEAQHNIYKKLKRADISKQQSQLQKQKEKFKINEKIRDSRITQQGLIECKQVADTLNWDSIGVIIVSPLKRCLDTCQALLKFANKDITVCVQPMICARVSNSWSTGSSRKQLQKLYPQFSFNLLDNSEKIPWYLKNLCIQKQKKLLNLQETQKFLENGIKQDFFEFQMRIEAFKKILKNKISTLKQGQRILVISHNNVFRMITAKFFLQQGKCLSDLTFSSAQLKFLPSSKILQCSMPTPCL